MWGRTRFIWFLYLRATDRVNCKGYPSNSVLLVNKKWACMCGSVSEHNFITLIYFLLFDTIENGIHTHISVYLLNSLTHFNKGPVDSFAFLVYAIYYLQITSILFLLYKPYTFSFSFFILPDILVKNSIVCVVYKCISRRKVFNNSILPLNMMLALWLVEIFISRLRSFPFVPSC